MDTPESNAETINENPFVLFMDDFYFKLSISKLPSSTCASHIVSVLNDNYILPYGTRKNMLKDNGTQVISAFIAMLCAFLRAKHLKWSAYQLLINKQIDWFNKKIVARLENYVAEHHRDGDTYVQWLESGYST